MANLNETPVWEDGIFQLEKTTPPLGGAPAFSGSNPSAGHANVQGLQLANRTSWLKTNKIDSEDVSEEASPDKILKANSEGKIDVNWLPEEIIHYSRTLEQLGISTTNTDTVNAAILASAITAGTVITGSLSAYSFDFLSVPIIYTGLNLHLDLGPELHTFINWAGITANNLETLYYNGRLTAGGGYCKGLGRFRRLRRANIGSLEFQDVKCINPSAPQQFFALEYSSDLYDDNDLVINIDSIFIKNVITQTYEQSTGLAIPMTIIGNYGSSSSQVQQHLINIGNFHVEEYYSVAQDGTTPIDGDSDVVRLFTNPTQINIGNIYAKNIAKRFFKTQEFANVTCQNVYWVNDVRFPQNVFIGFFEAQLANSGVPTHFEIGACDAYNADGEQRPLLFNASGLDHTISISTLKYKNVGIFSSDRNIDVKINNATGSGLSVNARSSTRLKVSSIIDGSITGINASRGIIENFQLTFDPTKPNSTTFFLSGLEFKRGNFIGWRVNNRVAQFWNMEDVTLTYSTGDTYVRAFQPISGGTRRAVGVTITDATSLATQIFEGPASGTGTLVIRDFRATGGASLATGVITTGNWNVTLDNCVPSTFTGAGATVKTATYT